MVIKSRLLVYMVAYPCLIADFDHELSGWVAVGALFGSTRWTCPGLLNTEIWRRRGFWLSSWGREVWRCSGDASQSQRDLESCAVPLPGLWQCKRACAAKVCVAVVSRSVFLSGKAAKKNYEHPWHARGRNLEEIASTHMLLRGPPSTTALAYPSKYLNASKIREQTAGRIGG